MRLALVLLLTCLTAAADTVYLKGGRKIRGRIVSEDPEVVINPYNSTVSGMVFGVERFPKTRVKKIKRTLPTHEHEFFRRLGELETAEQCLELAAWCKQRKLKEHRLYALERGFFLDPTNRAIRKELGGKLPKGDPAEHRKLATRYLEGNDEERAAVLSEMRSSKGFPWSERYLQRALRSKGLGKGLQENRPLALRANKIEKPVYFTILVPDSYDPLVPTPLLFGLHGGGKGGKDGKEVVGSGRQAMPFYQRQCARRGWICVCPNAVVGGWSNRLNHDVVDAVLDELRALYNIDENRMYLTGHSMGGGGTWAQGRRLVEAWAAIAPTASFRVQGLADLEKTKTGFYVYHSADDPRTGIGGVRPYMLKLPGSKSDFVYTELPKRGHSLPTEVVDDIFVFFDMRRLTEAPRRKAAVRPRSSFLRKVSRDEKKYLPPLEGRGDGDLKLNGLLKDLRTGGGVAEQAVRALIKHPDPKVASRVGKILLNARSSSDVRMYSARVLAGRKAKESVKPLGRTLRIETDKQAVLAMLDALDAVDDPSAIPALTKFLRVRLDYYESRLVGSSIHWSDWIAIAPTMARACKVLERYSAEKAAPIVAKTVLEGVLLQDIKVVYDRQLQNPTPIAQALAGAACGALGSFGDPSVVPTLRRLTKRGPWAQDGVVRSHAEQAIAALQPH